MIRSRGSGMDLKNLKSFSKGHSSIGGKKLINFKRSEKRAQKFEKVSFCKRVTLDDRLFITLLFKFQNRSTSTLRRLSTTNMRAIDLVKSVTTFKFKTICQASREGRRSLERDSLHTCRLMKTLATL